eukprot:452019_1
MNYEQDIRPMQSELFANLLNNEKHTDVCFIIGKDKKEFKLHRICLAAISPVWEAMLFGQMKESEPNAQVSIPDIHPDGFQSVVNFAYNNDPKLTSENVLLIQQICDKYQIKSLLSICNAYILKNTVAICKSDVFLNLSIDSMQLFLKSDNLNITEEKLWEFVLKWAEHQSTQQPQKLNNTNNDEEQDEKKDNDIKSNSYKHYFLKSIRKCIRFGVMDGTYFAIHIVPQNVLTPVEVFAVFRYYHDPKSACGDFSCKVRQIISSSKAKILTYKLKMSAQSVIWSSVPNTAVALMNSNVKKGCDTDGGGSNKFIEISFDHVMMITKIEIGAPNVSYINGAKLQYKDSNNTWIDVKQINNLQQNIIHEIKVNVKAIAMRAFKTTGPVGIGSWRVFGCVNG